MTKQNLTLGEFYEKHCVIMINGKETKPTLRDVDVTFFDMVDKGKKIGFIKRRSRDEAGYMYGLARTARELTKGNKICLFSLKPDPYIADLKKFFNIDVTASPVKRMGKINKNAYHITLKNC